MVHNRPQLSTNVGGPSIGGRGRVMWCEIRRGVAGPACKEEGGRKVHCGGPGRMLRPAARPAETCCATGDIWIAVDDGTARLRRGGAPPAGPRHRRSPRFQASLSPLKCSSARWCPGRCLATPCRCLRSGAGSAGGWRLAGVPQRPPDGMLEAANHRPRAPTQTPPVRWQELPLCKTCDARSVVPSSALPSACTFPCASCLLLPVRCSFLHSLHSFVRARACFILNCHSRFGLFPAATPAPHNISRQPHPHPHPP